MNYLHIGLPKTATTTLQEEVFPNLENYLYLGKSKNDNKRIKRSKTSELVTLVDKTTTEILITQNINNFGNCKRVFGALKDSILDYNKHSDLYQAVKQLFSAANQLAADSGLQGWCYSDESFSFSGRSLNCKTVGLDKKKLLEKAFLEAFYETLGSNTTGLVVFRDPVELITSFYYTSSRQRFISFKNGDKTRRPLRFDEFLDKQQTLLEYGAFQSILDPCFQQDFLNKLKQCMPVIARDFEQLKQGDDVIKTLGITDSKSHPALKDLSTMNTRYEKPDVLKYMAAGYKKDTMTKEQIQDHALETLEARGLIKAFEQQRIQF